MPKRKYSTRVIQGASATVGGCPKESIQPRLYRVPRVIQSVNIFLGIGNRSRDFWRGKLVGRYLVGGEVDALGGKKIPRWDCTVCVRVGVDGES